MMFSPSIFFYPRDAMLARSLPSKDVCLSVCPSHAGILSKRLNLYFGPYGNPHHSGFSDPCADTEFQREPRQLGRQIHGVGWKIL